MLYWMELTDDSRMIRISNTSSISILDGWLMTELDATVCNSRCPEALLADRRNPNDKLLNSVETSSMVATTLCLAGSGETGRDVARTERYRRVASWSDSDNRSDTRENRTTGRTEARRAEPEVAEAAANGSRSAATERIEVDVAITRVIDGGKQTLPVLAQRACGSSRMIRFARFCWL